MSQYQYDNNSDVDTKRDLTKVLVKNVKSLVNQKTNDGTIEAKYIAEKRLEAEWKGIKKGAKPLKVHTFGTLGSPEVADLRILFFIKWPLMALNRGP